MCQHDTIRTTNKMVIISLKCCVILSVIISVVQPINGAANANATAQQSDVPIYSEAGMSKPVDNSKQQTKSNINSSSSNNTSVKGSISSNSTEGIKHRGIYPTNNESGNGTTTNNDKVSAETAKKNVSQITLKVEQKPTTATTSVVKTVNSTIVATTTSKKSVSTTASTSTSTSTTTTTTTKPKTTTTTAIPKKPTVTYSVEDFPAVLEAVQAKKQTLPAQPVKEQPVEPLSLQSSETISYPEQKSSHNFVMSIIGMIVAVPFVVLITNCAVRRVRDYWSKRRYRRMDYLIEDMYN